MASPVFQAPIGSIASPELAAAVSNASGLGHPACTWRLRGRGSETLTFRLRKAAEGRLNFTRCSMNPHGRRSQGPPPTITTLWLSHELAPAALVTEGRLKKAALVSALTRAWRVSRA